MNSSLELIVSYDINLVPRTAEMLRLLKDGERSAAFCAREAKLMKRQIEESKPGHWSRFVRTVKSIRESNYEWYVRRANPITKPQ